MLWWYERSIAVESSLVTAIHVVTLRCLISSTHVAVITVTTLILVVVTLISSHVIVTLILILVIQCVHTSSVVHWLERWLSRLESWLEWLAVSKGLLLWLKAGLTITAVIKWGKTRLSLSLRDEGSRIGIEVATSSISCCCWHVWHEGLGFNVWFGPLLSAGELTNFEIE